MDPLLKQILILIVLVVLIVVVFAGYFIVGALIR